MKTIITFLIAILAFAGTVAWAGEPARGAAPSAAGARQSDTQAPAARTAAPAQRAGSPHRGQPAPAAGAVPAGEFRIELPDAPAVFCACVSQRRLG